MELLELGYGLTNAAYRTTKGSGDLRRADFEGSQERLERLAAELRPGWIAFVGKSSYQGAFGVPRCELGQQERALGDTRLFVLPSTSPANAAVPYDGAAALVRGAGRRARRLALVVLPARFALDLGTFRAAHARILDGTLESGWWERGAP